MGIFELCCNGMNMSVWRRKAIESFPELRKEFEDPETSIYGVFLELLPMAREAHSTNDRETLVKIYTYASWCARQKEQILWNAAGVSFYEHLVENEMTLEGIPEWVPSDIFVETKGLMALMLNDADKYAELIRAYNKRNKTNFPTIEQD